MAKKRGVISALANTAGAEQSIQKLLLKDVESLSNDIKNKVRGTNISLSDVVKEHFGISGENKEVEWVLESGKKAKFAAVTLTYEQVLNDTVVTFEINGREQESLTPESLRDLDSLCFQQYYPAIGRLVDGKIDVLDGSRRRRRFLLEAGKLNSFDMLITEGDLSKRDAKALATQLQSVKEHNLRETGLLCVMYKDAYTQAHGIAPTQFEIAKEMRFSQAKVSRAMNAAAVSESLVRLFPDISLLSSSDYVALRKVDKALPEKELLSVFVGDVKSALSESDKDMEPEDYKLLILSVISKQLKGGVNKKPEKPIVTHLAEFNSLGMYARKKVKGRDFSYEFGRLPSDVQARLDSAIKEILNESLS